MAVLWKKESDGNSYEVRSAGQSRRLYRNGVFHSQFNESRPFAGGVWDLLLLPAFFLSKRVAPRILVMGVGGGAVIRQLQRYFPQAEIVAVDLDPLHLEIAQRFFAVNGVTLHCADAKQWILQYQGEPFDLIIDDLFGEVDGDPWRAVDMDEWWSHLISRRLTDDGVLVANFISLEQLLEGAFFSDAQLLARYRSAFAFSVKGYQNVIGAFVSEHATSRQLRQRVLQEIGSAPEYSIRSLQRAEYYG